jgi:hypothetical protein
MFRIRHKYFQFCEIRKRMSTIMILSTEAENLNALFMSIFACDTPSEGN